jgi:hypothetical protein
MDLAIIGSLRRAYNAYRAACKPLCLLEWRQGRSEPRNVYARTGGTDWKADHQIGQFHTPELAAECVQAHNAALPVPHD